ncbi:MAG: carboxylating nicotinate-nucleotide diphosphorylase [Candidatus Omnitrophota bacterium]|nr:MAG: carboxylating nicotinate-nucleotide diphosphorylase [Candidatus Omnitrophota bacterium]
MTSPQPPSGHEVKEYVLENGSEILPLNLDDEIREIIAKALHEDKGDGDITTIATIPPNRKGAARVFAKATGVLCGTQIFMEVYRQVNQSVEVKCWAREGQTISPGRTIFTLDGPMGAILTGERVALNFLGILSGVSTTTSEHVKAVRHTKARITDTRKTTPLYRRLQKYAVRVGGGVNHRHGLYDMMVIKDNHIDSCGGILMAVNAAKKRWGNTFKIEVETRDMDEVREAIQAGVDRIMLDNMDVDAMTEAVRIIDGRAETEASGGINLNMVSFVAETGVDYISIGALTHSTKCIDFSLVLDRQRTKSQNQSS